MAQAQAMAMKAMNDVTAGVAMIQQEGWATAAAQVAYVAQLRPEFREIRLPKVYPTMVEMAKRRLGARSMAANTVVALPAQPGRREERVGVRSHPLIHAEVRPRCVFF